MSKPESSVLLYFATNQTNNNIHKTKTKQTKPKQINKTWRNSTCSEFSFKLLREGNLFYSS